MRQLKSTSKTTGLAISAILLAVVLLAAIAVTIAMSSRSGNANSAQQQDKLSATTIMQQAQQFQTAFQVALSNGIDITTVTATWLTPSGNMPLSFSPASAGLPTALLPPIAASSIANFPGWGYAWAWHGYGNLVQNMNVGDPAGNYLLDAHPITPGVCQQINQMLFGNPSILTSSSNLEHWTDGKPTDASNDPAVDGSLEGCVVDATYTNYYHYYKVILPL